MKILFVAPYFYPKIGGLENYVLNICLGLRDKFKCDVVVVTTNHESRSDDISFVNGVKVYRLKYWFRVSNTPVNPLWYFDLKKIIRQEQPDLINVHAPVPYIADIGALASGSIPVIVTYHAGSMQKNRLLIDLVIKIYENYIRKYMFNKAKYIISYSQDFIDKYLICYKDKVRHITPGIDTALFKPDSSIIKKNIALFVGRIETTSDWKGIDYLLDAVPIVRQQMPDFQLLIVGGGDATNKHKAYATKMGFSQYVKFLGPLSGNELAKVYQQARVFVLPSTSEAESFGIVLIEAMACATPVIGSNIGGIPYVIDNRYTGLLVPPKNPEAIAHSIIKILHDKKLAKFLSKNGLEKVMRNYIWKVKINETYQLITQALK